MLPCENVDPGFAKTSDFQKKIDTLNIKFSFLKYDSHFLNAICGKQNTFVDQTHWAPSLRALTET